MSKDIKKEDLHLLKQIGSGGFSTVFKGTLNDEDVAVKKLHKFDKHEIDVLQTLNHPHIVKFIGSLQDDFNLYLVLELCRGGSLRSYLDRKRFENKLLPIYQVCDWATQAIQPIRYLRARHLVHKDIKSANYLIADNNVLKLADFGIARNIVSTIQNATQSGSTAYGTPELLKDRILSPSYDISAYGVVVWELCTTLVPFEGLNIHSIIQKIWKNERPAIPANCPKPLTSLMTKCWDVDWKKRPYPDEILQLLSQAEKQAFIAGPWKCEKVFGQKEPGKLQDPSAITINPTNQDVAVVDRYMKSVVVYHITGEFKFKFSIKHHLVVYPWVWDVAVSNNGNYYITNGSQFVYCYNQSGIYKRKWVAVSPDNTLLDSQYGKLHGLAIDHTSNLLLVGVWGLKYISKHNLNGTHVNSIKVNILPHFLAVTIHGTIIISDTSVAQILDQKGQMLYALEPPSYLVPHWSPYGVCCHKEIIFICIHSTNQIVCFSMHGEFLGSIPVAIDPYSLTFVQGEQKFLVSSYSDKHVHMYSH